MNVHADILTHKAASFLKEWLAPATHYPVD